MRQRLSAEQQGYILAEMERLERFLSASGVPSSKIKVSLLILQADLGCLLSELDIKVLSVERACFLAYWKGWEDEEDRFPFPGKRRRQPCS